MTTRRKPGEGTVRTLPSGRFQPGVTHANGKRKWSRETFATREEAEAALLAIRAVMAEPSRGGATLGAYGRAVLDRVERRKVYAPKTIISYRNRFHVSIEPSPLAEMPLRSISQRQVAKHLDEDDAKLARGTAIITLAVLRLIYAHAMRDGLVESDPTQGYRWPRRRRLEAGEPTETRSFFTLDQFDALCAVATPAERCTMRIAITTGLRLGEMIALHRRDVHLDSPAPFIRVRYGGRHGGQLQPTKGKIERTVYLTGPAHEAVSEWVREHLPAYETNPAGLMFPTVRGEYRSSRRFLCAKRGAVERWQALLAAAGLSNVRPALVWHSFRHTAATFLLSGMWGHKWTPEEVQQHLGHSSLDTTLGYARIVDDRLAQTAARTGYTGDHDPRISAGFARQATQYQLDDIPQWNRDVAAASERAVVAIARGEFDAAEALARMVLAHPMVVLALAVLDGGPFAANRALDLVRVVANVDAEEQALTIR